MTLNAPSHFDVIIIGAGSVGTPTAFSMAASGLKTLVIDKFPCPGQGSNKKAIGGLRATHSDPAKIRLGLRSLEIFSGWKERFGDEIEWHKGGYSYVAYHAEEEKTLKDLLVIQKSFGLNISWLDRQEMMDLVPGINPDGLIGGTLSPDDGNASPLLSVEAFASQAKRLGAVFHFRETVTDLLTKSGRVAGVKTDKGEYGAGIVINAAGAWTAGIDAGTGYVPPVRPDSHEAAVTEPVERFLEPMVVDIRPCEGSANYYFYQHKTGQVVFCITPSPHIWGTDERETSVFLPLVARRMVTVLPRLANIRVRRTWRGLYPMTPDGFPLVGHVKGLEGYILASGMCGQGFMLGPGVGELLTRMVHKNMSREDIEILPLIDPHREFKGMEKLQ